MDFVNLPILVFSVLLCISILTSLFSLRAGVPLILIFLCIGLITGSSGLPVFEALRRPRICLFIGSLALALILFDSGFQTEMRHFRMARRPAVLLATLGVLITATVLAPFGRWVLNIGWVPAFLLASVISSTDSAAVFFLLRSQGLTLREKVKATLEVESGANDPMAIFLTVSCILLLQNQALQGAAAYGTMVSLFLGQILVGGGMGYLCGQGMRVCLNAVRLENALYPIFVTGMVLLEFAATNMLGGSGFLAVYMTGLLLGNSRIQARTPIARFHQTLTWLSQITMFTCLGLFVTIDGLQRYWKPALALSFLLMIVVRPVMVWGILSFFRRYSRGEKFFISFVGLRGATSVLLALMPIVYALDFAEAFFNIVFVMVLLSLSIQGFFIPMMARRSHVVVPPTHPDPATAEIDLPGLVDSSLILYQLTDSSPVVRGETIPRWAIPSLVVRKGVAYFSGGVLRRLQPEDKVYVFLPSGNRRGILDHLYGAGTDGDVLNARDIFGDFPISPTATFGELANLYGIRVPEHMRAVTIADFMHTEFSDIEIGDRLSLDTVELVVRSLDNGMLTGVGLDIDPTRQRSFYAHTRGIKTED